MSVRPGRTRPNPGAALAVLVAFLMALAAVPGAPPAWGRVPAGPGTASSLEDAAYCRSARHMSGIVYYQVLTSSKEQVPVAEVHTAANVHARFLGGRRVSVALPRGLRDGDSWALSPPSGRRESFTVPDGLPALAGGQHLVFHAVWNYVTKRVVCVDKDGRTGRIARRDITPRWRYVPVGRATGLVVGAAATAPVPRCASDRSDAGRARMVPGEADGLVVTPAAPYLAAMPLSGIGLPASVSVGADSRQAVRFWTSSGSSWLCGDAGTLARSVRFFANAL